MAKSKALRGVSAQDDNVEELGEFTSFDEESNVSRTKTDNRWKRKRANENKGEGEEEEEMEEFSVKDDPLEVFGRDVMMMILNNLDALSVAQCLLVSRRWHDVASSDRLWSFKGRITRYDLCDHVWEFHFYESAPEYWRNLDPYWKGGGLRMRRYFHLDCSQTADPGDRSWGGHECCYSTVTGIVADGKIREHYVRINRWPGLRISRKHDWSWEMSNNLYSCSSIPDANKVGGTGPPFPATSLW